MKRTKIILMSPQDFYEKMRAIAITADYSIVQVAKLLKRSYTSIKKLISEGKIKVEPNGRISLSELNRFLSGS
jgi:hypothetical protein